MDSILNVSKAMKCSECGKYIVDNIYKYNTCSNKCANRKYNREYQRRKRGQTKYMEGERKMKDFIKIIITLLIILGISIIVVVFINNFFN